MAWGMTFNSVPRPRPMVGASKTLEKCIFYLLQCVVCAAVYVVFKTVLVSIGSFAFCVAYGITFVKVLCAHNTLSPVTLVLLPCL